MSHLLPQNDGTAVSTYDYVNPDIDFGCVWQQSTSDTSSPILVLHRLEQSSQRFNRSILHIENNTIVNSPTVFSPKCTAHITT